MPISRFEIKILHFVYSYFSGRAASSPRAISRRLKKFFIQNRRQKEKKETCLSIHSRMFRDIISPHLAGHLFCVFSISVTKMRLRVKKWKERKVHDTGKKKNWPAVVARESSSMRHAAVARLNNL